MSFRENSERGLSALSKRFRLKKNEFVHFLCNPDDQESQLNILGYSSPGSCDTIGGTASRC